MRKVIERSDGKEWIDQSMRTRFKAKVSQRMKLGKRRNEERLLLLSSLGTGEYIWIENTTGTRIESRLYVTYDDDQNDYDNQGKDEHHLERDGMRSSSITHYK